MATTVVTRGTYLLLDSSLHLEVVHMQTALCLLLPSGPASRALASVALSALDGAVPVTNAAVALVEKLIPRNVVLANIPLDEVEVPGVERVQLEEAGAVNLERLQIGAIGSL